MVCDIIIAIWNRKELSEACIESIIAHTRFPYRIVAIDNGSDEPTKSYLESMKLDPRCDFRLIRNETNIGNTLAGNQGMQYSDAEYVCNLDNDTVVTDGWLTELINVAASDPAIGLVTSCLDGHPPHFSPETVRQWALAREQFTGQYLERGVASGFCCLIKRELINTIGVWDEAFSPGYFEDTEYSLRAKKHGYKSVAARAVCVYHKGQASFKKRFKNKELDQLFARNRARLYELYGKPVRAAYIITRPKEIAWDPIISYSRQVVDNEGRIWFFVRKTVDAVPLFDHGNIFVRQVPEGNLGIFSLWKVLTKKKKFDEVYSDSRLLFYLLAGTWCIHRAKVKLLKGKYI